MQISGITFSFNIIQVHCNCNVTVMIFTQLPRKFKAKLTLFCRASSPLPVIRPTPRLPPGLPCRVNGSLHSNQTSVQVSGCLFCSSSSDILKWISINDLILLEVSTRFRSNFDNIQRSDSLLKVSASTFTLQDKLLSALITLSSLSLWRLIKLS